MSQNEKYVRLDYLKNQSFDDLSDLEKKEIYGYYYELLENQKENIFKKDFRSSLMFVKSLDIFFNNRNNEGENIKKYKIGHIYFANMLLGYNNESAYEHPVMVLGKSTNSLFVIPMTSSPKKFLKAFGADNLKGKKHLVKANFELNEKNLGYKKKIHSFFKGKPEGRSVFMLNDVQMISPERISDDIYFGKMYTSSQIFQFIEEEVFKNTFNKKHHERDKLIQQNEKLAKEIDVLNEIIKKNDEMKNFSFFVDKLKFWTTI